MQTTSIVWFRRDLRLSENQALTNAIKESSLVVPLYIYSPEEEAPWQAGAASKWWLHHSLKALDEELQQLGSKLIIRKGETTKVIRAVIKETKATAVYWNRLYDPAIIARDTKLKETLKSDGLEVQSFNGHLLFEPWEIKNGSNKPYQVYTPFSKTVFARFEEKKLLPPPKKLPSLPAEIKSIALESLKLLPKINWHSEFGKRWQPGETGAKKSLAQFLKNSLGDYKAGRDFPILEHVSFLSPALHFGEISPREIWQEAVKYADRSANISQEKLFAFQRQLIWRDFAHHLLFHFPHTDLKPLRPEFAKFPWKKNAKLLKAWQAGLTGYPIVDAGMRELWTTGIMHNRVRMIVASFLVKDLLISWQDGARWFWDTLIDADLANNTMGWQWVAGSGADAAPYFRIFNPILQGEKFDKDGLYVKRWVPELKNLPAKWIHKPFSAPSDTLSSAAVVLGKTYPKPIVDHSAARDAALEAYQMCRK